MKKKIWLFIICLMLFIPTIQVASKTTKKCTDYTYDTCPDGKTDEAGNTCKKAGDSCYIKKVATTCQAVKTYSCTDGIYDKSTKKYICCNTNSMGTSCIYDVNTKKCKDVATTNRREACTDFSYDECPKYSDNGTACIQYDGLCQSGEALKNSQSETSSESNTMTSDGKIKAITCTGNEQDKIPETLPKFIRSLYKILKILVPLFIIFLGIFDFVRASTTVKDSDMSGHRNKFIRRLIAGVIIFFVFTFVQWVFGLIGEQENILGCVSCFLTDEKYCQSAGYISPGKDKNGEPNKTPPTLTNKVELDNATNSAIVKKILKEAKKVTDYVRKNHFTYGDAPLNPAMYHNIGITSCDRCVGWVLYNLGYKKQPKTQGLTLYVLRDFCKKNGFKKITNIKDVKPGDIVFQRASGSTSKNITHVFIIGNKKKNGMWERYDCGLQERIDAVQPLTYDFMGNKARFLFAYRVNKLPK